MTNRRITLLCSMLAGLILLVSVFALQPTTAQEEPEEFPEGVKSIQYDLEQIKISEIDLTVASDSNTGSESEDLIQNELIQTDTSLFYSGDPLVLEPNQGSIDSPMATADFNNDSLIDLVIERDGNLIVYYQQPDASFSTGTQVGATFDPWSIGDFNGDDLTDIVYIVNDPAFLGYQFVLQNNQGAFDSQSIPFTKNEYIESGSLRMFYALDLNGDGYDDIARLSGEFGATWTYLISDGAGGYAAEVEGGSVVGESYLRSQDTIQLDPTKPKGIIYSWEDLESSQNPEIPTLFNIFIDQYVNGVFTNTHTIEYELAPQAFSNLVLEQLDVNHDGLDDILLDIYFYEDNQQTGETGQRSQIIVWLQQEDHEFAEPYIIEGSGKGVQAMAMGDVNLDGVQDLVTLNGDSFPGDQLSFYFLDADGAITNRVDKQTFGIQSNDWFFVEDMNGDNRPDIVSGGAIFYHNGQVSQVYLPNLFSSFIAYQSVYDDFSDPTSGWPTFFGENTIYTYSDGEYMINSPNADFFGLVTPNFPAYEYNYTVKGRKTFAEDGGYGVVVELNDDFTYFKGLLIFPDFGVAWLIDVNSEGRLQVLDEVRNLPRLDTDPYQFQVNRSSGTTNFTIIDSAGSEVYFSTTYVGGEAQSNPHRVGFITLPIDTGFEARFDDFALDAYTD